MQRVSSSTAVTVAPLFEFSNKAYSPKVSPTPISLKSFLSLNIPTFPFLII